MEHDAPISIGIDEAGRGCLAGPVVAAAVILPPTSSLVGLDDSKKLSPAKRSALVHDIRSCALSFGIGIVWQKDIDRVNILQATFIAMSRATANLAARFLYKQQSPLPRSILHIDGNKTVPPAVLARYWQRHCPPVLPKQKAFVGGDALLAEISAASILAKTIRDHIMTRLHLHWPVYNFAKHKGYGTKEHLTALQEHGHCPLHRTTFARVLPPYDTTPSKAKTKKISKKVQGTLL